jgi:hypothetical protein
MPNAIFVSDVDRKTIDGSAGQTGLEILRLAIEDAKRKLPFNGANAADKGFTSPVYAADLLQRQASIPRSTDWRGMPNRRKTATC